MKILVLIHEFPPVGGGGGHVAQDLSAGFAERGHQVKVLTANLVGSPDLEQKDSRFPFQIMRVPTLRKDPARASLPAMLSFLFSAFVKGLQIILRWNPDVIHVHFAVPSGPVAWLLSKVTGTPYLLTVHLGDVPGGTPEKTDRWFRLVKPFTYPVWKDASQVIAVSEFTRRLARKTYDVPIDVIHNGIDLNEYPVGEIEVHQPPRIVFAGRFVPQKNPLLVIRTLGQLKDLDWELVMLGDGELFEEARQAIRSLGLGDRVRMPGWVTPEEVRNEFLRSDILFMPSLSEGLPVVGVQALAAGLAFVVSDIGGFKDIVEQGENGYKVPIEYFNYLLMNRLTGLLSDELNLIQFRKTSSELARKFDLDNIVKAYLQNVTRLSNRSHLS